MGDPRLTRTNLLLETADVLLLETADVRGLRKILGSRSNSEAVRRAIEERLAVEEGLAALRDLQKPGGLEDVFNRAPARSHKLSNAVEALQPPQGFVSHTRSCD